MAKTDNATISPSKWRFIAKAFSGWRRWVVLTLLGLPITFVTVLYPAIQPQFKWPLLIDLWPLQNWVILTATWYFLTLVVVIWIVVDSSHRYTKEIIAIKERENESINDELNKTRQELRKAYDAQVVDVPDTLRSIVNWYDTTTNELKKSKSKPNSEVYLKILTELFEINSLDEIIKIKKMSHQAVNEIIKRVKKRMGIDKRNKKPDLEWARRIYSIIDSNGVGLMRNESVDYQRLKDDLSIKTAHISQTKLHKIIWDYVDNTYSAFSLKILVHLGDVNAAMVWFPPQVRIALGQMDDRLERACGSGLAQINQVLERYRSGESIE